MAPTNHTIQLALLLKEGTAGIGAAAAATVPSAERRRVRLVMGNESADLDSVVCSVVYAHWLSLTHAAARTSVSSPRSAVGTSAAVAPGAVSPVLICPVINVPRRDLPLRTDVKWMLDRVSIDLNHLVYIDDPDVVALALHSGSLADLDVVLVDHNVLLPLWEGHASTVVEIIDHHEDTQLYRAAKRTIAPSGSCASLVAARIAIATGEDTPVLGPQGTELLLAAIYADTAGMTMRVTAEDTAAVEQLIVQTPGLDIDTLFHQCRDKKDDVSHLTIAEMFRKDYKTRSFGALKIGAAAMSAPLAVLIAKGDVYKAAQEYAEAHSLDVLLIMTSHATPEFTRELAVYTSDPTLLEGLCRKFETDAGAKKILDLERTSATDGIKGMGTYIQHNTSSSRKKMLPLLQVMLADGIPQL